MHPAIDPNAANQATGPCEVSRMRVNHHAPAAATASSATTASSAERVVFDAMSRLASPAIVSTRSENSDWKAPILREGASPAMHSRPVRDRRTECALHNPVEGCQAAPQIGPIRVLGNHGATR